MGSLDDIWGFEGRIPKGILLLIMKLIHQKQFKEILEQSK